jgi:hypothetical protein
VTQEVEVQTKYLDYLFMPRGARLEEYKIRATGHDQTTENGLILEGFGVGNPYIPGRRLNEKMVVLTQFADRPTLQYEYDCQGPNIDGLHVVRTMEPLPDESSMIVRWRLENRGKQDLWVSPWVRSETVPGGRVDAADRVDAPTLSGVRRIERSGYHPASRNWIAATDTALKESVYGVYHVDHLHSFLGLLEGTDGYALQAAFVPRLFKPGDSWETIYRLNTVRGLSRIDFASEELAAQIDYTPGKLVVRIAAVKTMPTAQLDARVATSTGRTWTLPAQQFTASPEKVVLCTYDWTAPTDGPYEFLARVTSNGQTLDLNKNMAPPHGGIDTQFVVGQPKEEVFFEAWSNAPYAIERGTRTLKRALAAQSDAAVWFESSLEKIFRKDVPAPTGALQPRAKIGLARNERESFQVVVRPPEGKRLRNVRVRVGDLVGPGGAKIPAENVSVYNVRYYPVRVPSHFEGPTGDWPDALTPFAPFDVNPGETAPTWLTVYAPPGIPAGVYRGPLTVESPELGRLELGIDATVYDFDLPDTPALKTDFGFWQESAIRWARHLGYKGSEGALVAAYMQNALEHRVTLREPARFPAESPNYAQSLREFEERLKELQARGATTFAVPESLAGVPEQLQQANAFVVRNKLQGRAFCPIADEPERPAWPRLSERMQEWQRLAPDIPMMVTTSGLEPYLPELGKIWGVHIQMLDTLNNEPILARIKEGGEVWTFVNRFPARPYANLFIDFPAIDHRILFWQAWALGVRGFHYWAMNFVEEGQNPYVSQLDITPTNGDGFLVYPGATGPVNSIRWENIRDGIEDYDYLVLLKVRGLEASGNRALTEKARKAYDLGAVVPNLVGYTRDPQVLISKRTEIAQAIAELSKGR